MLQSKISDQDLALRIKDRDKEIPGPPYIIEEMGVRFSFEPTSYDRFTSWFTFTNDAEREARGVLMSELLTIPSPKFIDIGALCGSWTLPMLAMGTDVISIEPDPHFFEALKSNISMNDLESKWKGLNVAVYSEDMTTDIYDMKDVKVCKLDSLDLKIKRLDLVKVDVEGAELDVIKGGENFWNKVRPVFWIECHRPENIHDVTEELKLYYPDYVYRQFSLLEGVIHLYATDPRREVVGHICIQ